MVLSWGEHSGWMNDPTVIHVKMFTYQDSLKLYNTFISNQGSQTRTNVGSSHV